MPSGACMRGPRAPTPQRCSAGYSSYRHYILEGWSSEIQYPNHDTEFKTSLAMQNATVQQPLNTVSPNSNPTIVKL
ncbi:hypothetical protein TNCV_5017561 [Trichonephila clavipes]|nr:hypothetical protein TNCV_5017561 [Trichonephila clavipes]